MKMSQTDYFTFAPLLQKEGYFSGYSYCDGEICFDEPGSDVEKLVQELQETGWRENAISLANEREADAARDAAVREAIWELGEARVAQKDAPQRKAGPQGLITQSGSEPAPFYGAAPEPMNMGLIGGVLGVFMLVIVGLVWLVKKRS